MSGADFLDTNILVYAYRAREPEKQSIARALLEDGVLGRRCISSQVLTEFSAVMLHKVAQPVAPADLFELLDELTLIRTVNVDQAMVRRAVEVKERYGIHFYDAMIVAAALRGRCRRILSEDLNPGQEYFGVRVVNPFAAVA